MNHSFGTGSLLNEDASTRTPQRGRLDEEYRSTFVSLKSPIFRLRQLLGPLFMAAVEPLLELGAGLFCVAFFLIR